MRRRRKIILAILSVFLLAILYGVYDNTHTRDSKLNPIIRIKAGIMVHCCI
jgi:hypothetical protein